MVAIAKNEELYIENWLLWYFKLGYDEITIYDNNDDKNWLQDNALCIVELEKTEQISIPSCYKFINERIYGIAKVLFLQYTKQD